MKGFDWYSRYIAEVAADGQYPGDNSINSTLFLSNPNLQLYKPNGQQWLLIVASAVAPVFLVGITLVTSIAIPLLFVRFARTLAVLWNWKHNRSVRDGASYETVRVANDQGHHRKTPFATSSPEAAPTTPISYIPILLGNSGTWISDAWCSLSLACREFMRRRLTATLAYSLYTVFALVAVIVGPLAAFMISREVTSGFAGGLDGPCITQYNFSYFARNADTNRSDHHGRAMDLMPFLGNFKYSWSARGGDGYRAGGPVVDPISGVKYERVPGCLLDDPYLCDTRFPHTHKVSAELTPSQMGLWTAKDWRFRMEGYCSKLNSSAMRGVQSDSRRRIFVYGLDYARNAESLLPDGSYQSDMPLGQYEEQRFARRKNIITDSYFVNNETEIGWKAKYWPPAVRALDVDAVAILTILPTTTDAINQSPGDELYLEPVNTTNFDFDSDQLAHILCWERLFVSTSNVESAANQSWSSWSLRHDFVQQTGLDEGLVPLMQMASTEFLIKPLRFLRGNTLLASVADTPRWEFNASLAAPVPFGAEMHRWAHIGLMDIAAKAARTTSGHFARGIAQNSTTLGAIQTPELFSLCNMIRVTQEGTISIPLWIPIFLLVILIIALAWWVVEFALTMLASAGYAGYGDCLRAFLILPASRPTALSASVVLHAVPSAVDSAEKTSTGWPDIQVSGDHHPGVNLIPRERGSPGEVMVWGVGEGTRKRRVRIL